MAEKNVKKEINIRNSNIELLRIIIMIMIVGGHFATHGWFDFNHQSITIPRLWWSVIEMGGNFGVVVFVLISGFFLIDNHKLSISLKKIVKLWGQIFFYSIILFGVGVVIGKENCSFINFIIKFFPITFSEWWFASTYFVMYLIHPFLNRLLLSFTEKEYQNFILFCFLVWSIIPTFTNSSFQSNPLVEFVFYYSIAGYIKVFGFRHKISSKRWLMLWFIFSLLKYLSCVCLMFIGLKYKKFSDFSIYFYSRQSILTVFSGISFFMAFVTIEMRYNRFINEIASAVFGVYLLHDSNLLRICLWKDIFHNSSFQDTILIVPYSIGVIFIVYIGCTLIDLGRKYLFERPIFRIINGKLDKWMVIISKMIDFGRKIIFGKEECRSGMHGD